MSEQTCFVKDYTCGGKCSNCGQCCSDLIPISEQEIAKIKAYMKKHQIKEQRHNAATGVDLTCPFRDERTRKCLIYEVRPEICRLFICNQPLAEIEKNKTRIYEKEKTVFMRTEFFGNTEDAEWFRQIMSGAGSINSLCQKA